MDTNVFVYLYDKEEAAKQERARRLMLDDTVDLVISTQVLSEFYVTVTRKIAAPLSPEQATTAIEALAELEVVPITRNLVLDATSAGQQHRLSYWDSLIIEAASRAGADRLLTEDLATGSTLRGVTIVNPFA